MMLLVDVVAVLAFLVAFLVNGLVSVPLPEMFGFV